VSGKESGFTSRPGTGWCILWIAVIAEVLCCPKGSSIEALPTIRKVGQVKATPVFRKYSFAESAEAAQLEEWRGSFAR